MDDDGIFNSAPPNNSSTVKTGFLQGYCAAFIALTPFKYLDL
jgi:hypothetical protein